MLPTTTSRDAGTPAPRDNADRSRPTFQRQHTHLQHSCRAYTRRHGGSPWT